MLAAYVVGFSGWLSSSSLFCSLVVFYLCVSILVSGTVVCGFCEPNLSWPRFVRGNTLLPAVQYISLERGRQAREESRSLYAASFEEQRTRRVICLRRHHQHARKGTSLKDLRQRTLVCPRGAPMV